MDYLGHKYFNLMPIFKNKISLFIEYNRHVTGIIFINNCLFNTNFLVIIYFIFYYTVRFILWFLDLKF